MSGFLERICAARREDARRRASAGALDAARDAVSRAMPPRDFHAALAAPGMSLIAEVKRSSPSEGAIKDVSPVEQASAYERGGARAISVLTEPDHFGGSLEDLTAVRAAVGVPVLRKDFIVEPLQVWEARAAGADAVLLIVAALEQTKLVSLMDLAERLGMAALVEAHTAEETRRAVDAGARIVGINTRNLQTLAVDPGMVKELRPLVPDGVLVVGESGVAARADVEALEAIACDAVLVGTALMRAPEPAAKVRELLGRD